MDEQNEAWLRTLRLEKLRARGWEGSARDYDELLRAMGRDPLDVGITTIEDLDDPDMLAAFAPESDPDDEGGQPKAP